MGRETGNKTGHRGDDVRLKRLCLRGECEQRIKGTALYLAASSVRLRLKREAGRESKGETGYGQTGRADRRKGRAYRRERPMVRKRRSVW